MPQGGLANLQKTVTNVGKVGFGSETPTPLPLLIGRIVQQVIALLGVIFLVLVVYGGYLWMTARGNDQQIEKAKDTIKAGVIGMAIMLGSYAISTYVVAKLSEPTLGTSGFSQFAN